MACFIGIIVFGVGTSRIGGGEKESLHSQYSSEYQENYAVTPK